MRITVPHPILSPFPSSTAPSSPSSAVNRIATFLRPGNVAVLTGAGVSVDSGIRAYRGKNGRYLNPNYKPILYHELMDEKEKGFSFRQRYWLRSYLGFPPLRDALPNTTHFALVALQYTSVVSQLITQNVDGLHLKALSHIWNPSRIQDRILELHGTLHKVRCKYGHVVDRQTFQNWLSTSNPRWKRFMDDVEQTGNKPRTNPDGDVALDGVSYDDFVVPDCPSCLMENRQNSVHKPEVIFFGESIPRDVKDRSLTTIEKCDRLFIIGTTLATYSAFRLVKHALELNKPVLLLNVGPSRADGHPGVEKIELASGVIMREVVKAVIGIRASEDLVVRELLQSGIMQPVPDDDDTAPRTP
ncbi:hypothetical protein PILCRDRAFT_812116 [Piloderma croceum F 1598]|uniref:Deacetylase sirtuin-type domain-containing protein n=1 Tax=Piloderma croceum (strain F 1598) TaxID=765440 RepID=A0A0C3GIB6_PILCF|nr:hypothetical protein PILCRDRAFT_812116 [Piloderma croceum F 1598]